MSSNPPDVPRASDNFYRNFFALVTFAAFICGIVTDWLAAFAVALAFGALSRTAERKNWRNPAFAGRLPWAARRSGEKDE